MLIKNIFKKDIDRDIKGVIKVEQSSNDIVKKELEEYVVTEEIHKNLDIFLSNYNKSINQKTDNIGVWISGFFGSGKSHFLKILSYILGIKELDYKNPVDFFYDKDIDKDLIKKINISREQNTDVILFNIDSKADAYLKESKNSIVEVFLKVFNEMQGLCSSMPWVADMERKLVKENKYTLFKEKFYKNSGLYWEDARENFYLEEENIVNTLSEVRDISKESARAWYKNAEASMSISIESFSNLVKDYLDNKGKNHRIVFLIDEIGQYIAGDTKLMLNLQTIVENLGSKCMGKAWVIVTSQESIEDISSIKGDDFSKIQGRFNTRLHLSSSNIDEVIRKRLLKKNDLAIDKLKKIYKDKDIVLKNIMYFSKNTPAMKFYRNSDDFIDNYPFIPYQFQLLQSVFTGIKAHSFTGKSLSDGERSLLSTIQQASLKYLNNDIGIIIPFYSFYSSIESFLDSSVIKVINNAKENTNINDFDIDILKLLFLLKYVKELPSNIENITTLMIDNIDCDRLEIKNKIFKSLNKLKSEVLIKQDGEEYIFLTAKEQEINREIKNIDVSVDEIVKKIGTEIFEGIFKDKKIKKGLKYFFSYNKYIDDTLIGQGKEEIGLKIITPYYNNLGELSKEELILLSARENNVIVRLQEDSRLIEEIIEVIKIKKYLDQSNIRLTSNLENIKVQKGRELSRRNERISIQLKDAIVNSEIYISGSEEEKLSKNIDERLKQAILRLVENIYINIDQITYFTDTKDELEDYIKTEYSEENISHLYNKNKEAIDNLKLYIDINIDRDIKISLLDIIDHFTKKPFGWRKLDILWIVITLLKRQDIKMKLNNEYIDINNEKLLEIVTSKKTQKILFITKRNKLSEKQISIAKDIFRDIFNKTYILDDEYSLMNRFKEEIVYELKNSQISIYDIINMYSIDNMYSKYYPGKDILNSCKDIFEYLLDIKDPLVFLEYIIENEEEMIDYMEDLDDIKNFFTNQIVIYKESIDILNIYMKNKAFITKKDADIIIEKIYSILTSGNPYGKIPLLKDLTERFINIFTEILDKESCEVLKTIEDDEKFLMDLIDKKDIGLKKDEIIKNYIEIKKSIKDSKNIAEILGRKEQSKRYMQRCMENINKVKNQKKVLKIKNINIKDLLKNEEILQSKEDIEEFTSGLSEELKSIMEENKIINLI